MHKDIIDAIVKHNPMTFKQVSQIYDITKSYDETIEIIELSFKYNRNVLEIAHFFYCKS